MTHLLFCGRNTNFYMLRWSEETSHSCVQNNETKEDKLTAYGFNSDRAGLFEVFWDRLCSMSPDRKTIAARMCVCLRYKWILTRGLCLHQPGDGSLTGAIGWRWRVGGWGMGREKLHACSPSPITYIRSG